MMVDEETPLHSVQGSDAGCVVGDRREIHDASNDRFVRFAALALCLAAVVAVASISSSFESKNGGSNLQQQQQQQQQQQHQQQQQQQQDLQDIPFLQHETPYVVPLPSEQDWCVMSNSKFSFFGTFRSPHDLAFEGLYFAPGRFQGTVLSAQDDNKVMFHLVNMTYGNTLSPYHAPGDDDEYDKFDTFCILYNDPSKASACYAPKFLSQEEAHHRGRSGNPTRCTKVELPSGPGDALCRQLGMAEFFLDGTVTVGPDVKVERWVSRLAVNGNPPNDYDGQIQVFLRNATEDGRFKIPVSHWVTSDDQSLEASFQLMDHEAWDPDSLPEIPEGCEHAIDISTLARSSDSSDVEQTSLLADGTSRRVASTASSGGKCPFAQMHHELILPSIKNHYRHA